MLYCGCMGDGRIWVYDHESCKVMDKIECTGARRLCFCDNELYAVSAFTSRFVRVADGSSVAIGKYPTGLFVHGCSAWISCGESDNIWVVDVKHMCPLEAYTCGAFPLNLCGQGALFAVTCLGTREVFLYHVKGEVCLHAQMTGIPYCAAPCGEGILYAGLYEHGSAVTYMDAQTAYTIPLGGCMPTEIRPYGNQRAVVTDCASGTVSFLDLENRKIIRKLQCTSMPDDICVLPNGIAITSMEDNCILLTDFDGKEPRCVRTGIEPRGLAYSSEDNRSV